jgi:flagellar biosynthetic protein FliR
MLPAFHFNETEMLAFSLVLLRVSAFIVSWPVFSVFSVPQHMKVLLSLAIASVLFPVINRTGLDLQSLGPNIIWLALKEVLTGLCLGFLTRMFFFAVSVGGNLVATTIGLANGQIFNPALGNQTTTVEQFYVIVGTLLFLAMNGHHVFLTGLAKSFELVPLSLAGINLAVFKDSGLLIQAVLESGIKIAAPVIAAIFIMNIAMGIIGRAVPQINVLVTSMPVNLLTGIVVMIVAIPALVFEMNQELILFADQLFKFMKAF